MKIIVDEMPYWADDCSFISGNTCKISGSRCPRYDERAGERNENECEYLITLDHFKSNNIFKKME